MKNSFTENSTSPCPPKQTLVDFLMGKLPAFELENCEKHLNECEPCGDTIRGLDANDTLIGLAGKAKPAAALPGESDQFIVKMLIDKLEELQPEAGSNTDQVNRSDAIGRADEVIQFLHPSNVKESFGRLAHYEILQVLGVGATSVVFRALDEQLHRQVALKVLRPSLGESARERFLAEARAAAALDHENIITIYQVATEGRLAFMAQQWLPGETLETWLQQHEQSSGEKPGIEKIKSISVQVAKGLAAAHAKNLIHRDIKPANIWIESERNRAIILDFGLVRVADDGPQITETGMIAGTPGFMSPEQTRGREIDARSDLFSLGCVMYRLCSGRFPFQAANTLATLQAIQQVDPAAPSEINSDVPNDLSDLVLRLLSKEVEGRPQTAEQVAQALSDPAALRHLLSKLPKPKAMVQTNKSLSANPPRRNWWLWGAAAGFLLALAAMAFAGPQIVRIVTNQGVLEIESDDPSVAIEVLQGGEVVYVIDEKTKQKMEISAGEYKIRPVGDGNSFELSQDTLTMKRGGKVIVTVNKLPAQQAAAGNQSESRLAPSDKANRSTTRQNQLTYENKTFDEWLVVLKTERSPAHLQTALQALNSLGRKDRPEEVAAAIMELPRIIDSATWEDGASQLLHDAVGVLRLLPNDVIIDAALQELKAPNKRSGDLLLVLRYLKYVTTKDGQGATIDPAFKRALSQRSEDFSYSLINLIKSNDENLEWSAQLLADLCMEVDWDESSKEKIIEALQSALPKLKNSDSKLSVGVLLAKNAPDTPGLEAALLENLAASPNAFPPYLLPGFNRALEGLQELGSDRIGEQTVQALTDLIGNKEFWPAGQFGGHEAETRNQKNNAINFLASLGAKAKSAMPVLQTIVDDKLDPYQVVAFEALIKLSVPDGFVEDIMSLQGSWDIVSVVNDGENELKDYGADWISIKGLRLEEVLGKGFSRTKSEYSFNFGEKPGQLDLTVPRTDSDSPRVRKAIYKLDESKLLLCVSADENGNRPMSFDSNSKSQILLELKRSTKH